MRVLWSPDGRCSPGQVSSAAVTCRTPVTSLSSPPERWRKSLTWRHLAVHFLWNSLFRKTPTLVVGSGSSLPIGVHKVTLRKHRSSRLVKRRGLTAAATCRPACQRLLFAPPPKRRTGRWAAIPAWRPRSVENAHSYYSLSPVHTFVCRRADSS